MSRAVPVDGAPHEQALRAAAQALVAEAVERVDLLVLVVAAQQVDLRRVADLQREQQHEHLERVRAAVDVVAQEDVRDVLDVDRRAAEGGEVAEQVGVLPVQIAEDLDGRAHLPRARTWAWGLGLGLGFWAWA